MISTSSKYLAPSSGTGKHSGTSCISYIDQDQPHVADDIVKSRNLMTTTNCGDFKTIAEKNFQNLKANGKSGDRTVSVYSLVQSFSKDELKYTDPDALEKCHQIGTETAREVLKVKGTRAFAVFTQADGQSHHLHNHILILNYDSNGHAITHGLSWKKTLRPINDQVTAEVLKGKVVQPNYTHKHITAKEAKSFIAKTAKVAVRQAKTENEFVSILAESGVKIRHRGHRDESQFTAWGSDAEKRPEVTYWKSKSGNFLTSLTLEYKGVKARTARLPGFKMTTEEIYYKLMDNKARSKNKEKTEVASDLKGFKFDHEAMQVQPRPRTTKAVQTEKAYQRRTRQRQVHHEVVSIEEAGRRAEIQKAEHAPHDTMKAVVRNRQILIRLKEQEIREILAKIAKAKKLKRVAWLENAETQVKNLQLEVAGMKQDEIQAHTQATRKKQANNDLQF